MAKRRKRSTIGADLDGDILKKAPKHSHPSHEKTNHAVLSSYFPTILPLRKYFIVRLSHLRTSASRRQALSTLQSREPGDPALCSLLDATLVGLTQKFPENDEVAQDIIESVVSCASLRSPGEGPSQPQVLGPQWYIFGNLRANITETDR